MSKGIVDRTGNDTVSRLRLTSEIAPEADGCARLVPGTRKLLNEAADEITALRAENERLRSALEVSEEAVHLYTQNRIHGDIRTVCGVPMGDVIRIVLQHKRTSGEV